MHRRLGMALGADRHRLVGLEAGEAHGRIARGAAHRSTGLHPLDVSTRRTVAHFTVDAAFVERRSRRLTALVKRQLTRVAGRARRLVDRFAGEFVESRDVGTSGIRSVYQLPIVEPSAATPAVLDREHQQALIGQTCRVRLLPFRANRVVHGIACPVLRVAAPDFDEVPAAVEHRARAATHRLSTREIADDVLWFIGPQHLRHAGCLPPFVLTHVTRSARV